MSLHVESGYFHRVAAETSTRMWINNPTMEQAVSAIKAGAVGCTTNPAFISKIIASPSERILVDRVIDLLVPVDSSDASIAAKVQGFMVARLADLFLPMYGESGGRYGFVTIQGDPFLETDAEKIVEEGLCNRKLAPNIMVKIPVTVPGIVAVQTFVMNDVPVMATEIMGIAQALSICTAYDKASSMSGNKPPFYVTHITGILDDHFKTAAAVLDPPLPPDCMKWAGLAVAKKQYSLLRQKNCPGTMLGGGARKLEDFTELVGGNLSVTINWEGSADALIALDGPAVSRINEPVDPSIIELLRSRLPDFVRVYDENGMQPEEYYDFGGVELFRNAFLKGWSVLLDRIAERRREAR